MGFKSPVTRNRSHAIKERRKKVTDLLRQGFRQWEIANMLGVHFSTVNKDLRIIEAIWLKSGILDLHRVKLRELNKLDEMEQECIRRLDQITDARSGSRYIEERRKIIECRCRILGINAPQKIEVKDVTETKEQKDAAVRAAMEAIDAQVVEPKQIEHMEESDETIGTA